jgi:hypothetical protein
MSVANFRILGLLGARGGRWGGGGGGGDLVVGDDAARQRGCGGRLMWAAW